MTDSADYDAPIRLCCGQRHNGPTCPDGKVMCCACFERFDVADLATEHGDTYDVCKGCAARVIPSDLCPTCKETLPCLTCGAGL